MNKLVVCLLSLMFTGAVSAQKNQDPVIIEIDGQPIKKSEFLQIYLKNNPNPSYDKTSLDNYMELFKKFKLKVHEAEALKYDTLPKLESELEGYRKQLSLPYLIDSAENKLLVKQAYDRMASEIKASHILIRLDENASPEDTLKAYNKIMALRKKIIAGADFATVAKGPGGSEDPSVAKNDGSLGYFSAFQMVYPFEDAAYNTPVGQVSMPVRTKFGYHLIYVQDKRPARGMIQTSHIMIMNPQTDGISTKEDGKAKIDEIYKKLQAGVSFSDLAKQYSEDQSSRNKGGELPPFGTGSRQRMVPEFEDAAFALKNDGDYSEPFKTDYGWHIVQRNSLTLLPPFDSVKVEIQNKVNRDARVEKLQASFVNKLKKQYKFKDYSKKQLAWFYTHIDSTIFTLEWVSPTTEENPTLFSFNKQNYTRKDFLKKLATLKGNGRYTGSIENFINSNYSAWQNQTILDYEESQLPNKYPEYKAIINEYHDGVLLYEIMNNKVWNKAIQDTTGLKDFFEKHASDFKWEDRIDATIYICDNQKIADKVYEMLQVDTVTSREILDVVNKDSQLNLQVKTNKYETERVDYLKGHQFALNVNKPYTFDGHYYVVDVNKKIPAGQKELSEARGAATAAYQNYLEAEWIKELENKYPVIINKEVLYSLGK